MIYSETMTVLLLSLCLIGFRNALINECTCFVDLQNYVAVFFLNKFYLIILCEKQYKNIWQWIMYQ